MKKYFCLYGLLVLIIFTGFLARAAVYLESYSQEVDVVAVNRLVRQVSRNWRDPQQFTGENDSFSFSVIDSDGTLIWKSDQHMPEDLPEAIERGFLPLDVIVGSSVVGKVLIETTAVAQARSSRTAVLKTAAAAFVLLLILNLIFLLLLYELLIKPFHKLEGFAHKIAIGRLDEPLPMKKDNLFGLFTQSFDLMRFSLREERQNRLKAERAKKELVASLSHDIRTPVTAIRAYVELLQLGNHDAATAEKLQAIEAKTDQIARLMNDLLHSTLEELEELKSSPVSAGSTILRELIESADHLKRTAIGSIPECLIEIDKNRMEQVIGNIISNSYKYADTKIDISGRICDDLLELDISDYGPGVEPEELDLLTEKFYRGENALSARAGGEGLGLYVAAILMEKGGGGLGVHNRADGFTVRLWLPLSR